MLIWASVDGAHKKELSYEYHWTATRIEILAIMKMNKICPYITKYILSALRTKSHSGKFCGSQNWSVINLTSPQFVSYL